MHYSMFHRLLICALSSMGVNTYASREMSHHQENYLSQQWLLKHTKACPNCTIAIQKNGGCDWMKCTMCKHEFCWECLAPHDHNIATHKHAEK